MSWLNYHHLMYFRTIAEEGSLSKASKKLLVGQPALSAQLKQLEESLGAKLFDRKNRGLHLTEAGKLALQYSNQISSLGGELQAMMSSKSFSGMSSVRVGALDSVPKTVIANLVEHTKNLGVAKVSLYEGDMDSLTREMKNANMDIILSNHSITSEDSNIFSISLGKANVALYGCKDYLGLKDNFPNSLHNQPIILPTSHSKLRHDIEHYFDLNKIQPLVVAEAQDTAVQKHIAMDGLGVVPLVDFSAKNLVHYEKLYEIGNVEDVFEEYWLISSKRTIKNEMVSKIVETYPDHIQLD